MTKIKLLNDLGLNWRDPHLRFKTRFVRPSWALETKRMNALAHSVLDFKATLKGSSHRIAVEWRRPQTLDRLIPARSNRATSVRNC
jgi:hypothetical protein